MQTIVEIIFDVVYLAFVITVGIVMIRRAKGDRQTLLFGVMAVVLGSGDAFHLVPRVYALCTSGLEAFTAVLGIGRMITSVTMTIFYLLLYHVWRLRYGVTEKRGLTLSMYLLALARIVLTLLPQNGWTSASPSRAWGIYRNIPFALMGEIVTFIFRSEAKHSGDKGFRHVWLAVLSSFVFYLPVVLWAETVPAIGALMIPKTCAYIWLVLIGYSEMRKRQDEK